MVCRSPSVKRGSWLPAQQLPGAADVRAGGAGDRPWGAAGGRCALPAGGRPHRLGELEDGHLLGIAEVDRVLHVGERQADEAVDQVGDVAEAAGLLPVSEDGEVLAGQGLGDEGRHHPAVVQPHPRSVGVEDADDAHRQPVRAPVGGDQRLAVALALVVDRARADRIDVAPVRLRLRMHQRIAVHLRGGGLEEDRPLAPGQLEPVLGAAGAHPHRLQWELGVVDGRGRRGEVEDVVQRALDVEGLADVLHAPRGSGRCPELARGWPRFR